MDMEQKIKFLREQQNMTLEELGNKVGVGKSTVRKWENGMIANMRRDKIAKIASALNCSPAYLMGWENEEKIANQLCTVTNSPKVQQLVEVVSDMETKQIDKVIDYAEYIKSKSPEEN